MKIKIPSGMMIGGASLSGKTSFVMKLLSNYKKMFLPIPEEIIYCYGEYGSHVLALEKQGITTFSGPPDDELLKNRKKPFLLIIDDMMLLMNEKYLNNLYTKKAHHQNFCVCFITQNIFDKKLRLSRNNSQYLALLRAPYTALDVRNLGMQIFPGKVSQFMECYSEVTKKPFNYLFLNLHPTTKPNLQIQTSIFPNEMRTIYNL